MCYPCHLHSQNSERHAVFSRSVYVRKSFLWAFKILGRKHCVKCTTLYISCPTLWLANIFFPVFPEKRMNCFCRDTKDISDVESTYFLISLQCPWWKMTPFRSSSIIMTFSELDKNTTIRRVTFKGSPGNMEPGLNFFILMTYTQVVSLVDSGTHHRFFRFLWN